MNPFRSFCRMMAAHYDRKAYAAVIADATSVKSDPTRYLNAAASSDWWWKLGGGTGRG